MFQPKTGEKCGCRRGVERDNCPACEGTGQRVDFKAIRQHIHEFEIGKSGKVETCYCGRFLISSSRII